MNEPAHALHVRGAFATPHDAVQALCARLAPVGVELVALAQAAGRVLAEAVVADRDSPPCDVSAMDGYALAFADVARDTLEVAGEVAIGQEPPVLPAGKVLRIFTGAPVPPGAELVIRREDVDEGRDRIRLHALDTPPAPGMNIRFRGENLRSGAEGLPGGGVVSPAVLCALASFGVARPTVRRRVRVGILNTGNELVPVEAQPEPWRIRDSNGPGLAALGGGCAWLDVRAPRRVSDDRAALQHLLAETLSDCDAVLLTGGVSAGQYDFVPEVVAAVGGEVVFHRLPIRPGGPLLGAVGPGGQAILGLPGNPVSVMVTARRFGRWVLRRLAGFAEPAPPVTVVAVQKDDGQTLDRWWFRLVRLTDSGLVHLVPTQGSGDLVSLARSDGFVEIPPHTRSAGVWPYYPWEAGHA
jgi:molybdopterin molybdotransferase